VGALTEKDYTQEVWKAIHDPDKVVVVQDALAVRAALGEEFGFPPGTLVTGKMLEALRRLGFDVVFDTNFAADLTIIEEGNELLQRIRKDGILPMITSCSPGWIKFIEHFYPQLLPHLSTCKSPHQMLGALTKTYYAQKAEIDPAKIVTVSIMPCTAKKFECVRPEMRDSGFQDVDYVLTTRELARMIKSAGMVLSQKIKNHPQYSSISILMLTSITRDTGLDFIPRPGEDLKKLNVDDFSMKPIKAKVLLEKVEKLLALQSSPGRA
jgi:iron only hydrogenase large subunit-like protein